jgi:hypothetical protein
VIADILHNQYNRRISGKQAWSWPCSNSGKPFGLLALDKLYYPKLKDCVLLSLEDAIVSMPVNQIVDPAIYNVADLIAGQKIVRKAEVNLAGFVEALQMLR